MKFLKKTVIDLIHVSTTSTANGNRLFSQSFGEDLNVLRVKKFFPSFYISKKFLKEKRKVFIFHQQYVLPNLIFCWVLNHIFKNENVIVYDVHDLLVNKKNQSLKYRLAVVVFRILEDLAFKLKDIRIITVSDGLASCIEEKSKKSVDVFYNMGASREVRKTKNSYDFKTSNKSVIYFGQINEERLPVAIVKKLADLGFSISVAGEFVNCSVGYQEQVKYLVESSGGRLHGRYSPNDLDFLLDYEFSIMSYPENSRNIRYCLPNKLFQSLKMGLTVICSSNMKEILLKFEETSRVISIEDFLLSYRSYQGKINDNSSIIKLEKVLKGLYKKNEEVIFKLKNLV